MRNFTNDPIFDDTLPVADGVMEVGTRVPLEKLRAAMEDWFRRKSYLPKGAGLVVEEIGSSGHPTPSRATSARAGDPGHRIVGSSGEQNQSSRE